MKDAMPADGLNLVVSSGLGLGVVAGVVSGICYVVIQGLRSNNGVKKQKYAVNTLWQCCICGAHFLPKDGEVKEIRRHVVCSECHGHACKDGSCSEYQQAEGTWLCKQCHKPAESWFKGILTILNPASCAARMSRKKDSHARQLKNKDQNEEKEIVRDFIERLVGAMLEADLDATSVNKLYKDPEYLPVTGQTPCTAHASLKTIIRRVLRDASNIGALQEPQEAAESSETHANQTYEDLLATAILNKVIDNYQHEVRRSSAESTSSKKSDKSNKRKKEKYSSYKEDITARKPQENFDSTSVSSVEDWCRSESSISSKHVDPITLTIKHSFEEVSTSDEDVGQHYLSANNLSRNSFRDNDLDRAGWQDNWLFSRRGKGSPKPVPVPMLVPSPSTEIRAMIGDRDADDTTDLSETGSDIEDAEDTASTLGPILIESKTTIGGKNLLDTLNPVVLDNEVLIEGDTFHEEFEYHSSNEDLSMQNNIQVPVTDIYVHAADIKEEDQICNKNNGDLTHQEIERNDIHILKENGTITENGMHLLNVRREDKEELVHENIEDEQNFTPTEIMADTAEARNDIIIVETIYEESDSLSSNTEKDAEYTEKYASLPRPIHKKSPIPSPRNSVTNKEDQNTILAQNGDLLASNENGHTEYKDNFTDESGIDETPIVIKGSYSERERQKWRNPVALSYNPYSKENLDKRLQDNSSAVYNPMFGRDYYVRQAKKSAGGKSNNQENLFENTGYDLTEPKSLPLNNSENFNGRYIEDQYIFTALPAVIDEEEEHVLNKERDELLITLTIKKNAETGEPNSEVEEKRIRPQSLALSSDSDDIDVERKYNIKTGQVYKYKIKDITKDVIQDAKSPVGIKEFIKKETLSANEDKVDGKYSTKLDENHNHACDDKVMKPVMKISSLDNLKDVGVVITETKSEENNNEVDIIEEINFNNTKQETNHTMRDISKAYLNSLIKNRPVRLEISGFKTPSISLIETIDNAEIELNVEDSPKKYKSCNDVRSPEEISQNDFVSLEYPYLKEKKIVRNFIEDFTKSTPNLHVDYGNSEEVPKGASDLEEISSKPSVKDLRKLFDNKSKTKENSHTPSHLSPHVHSKSFHKHVYSLTARSLPTEFRRELQQSSAESPNQERNDTIQTENADEELKHMPPCRSKIAFFECLKNK